MLIFTDVDIYYLKNLSRAKNPGKLLVLRLELRLKKWQYSMLVELSSDNILSDFNVTKLSMNPYKTSTIIDFIHKWAIFAGNKIIIQIFYRFDNLKILMLVKNSFGT